MVYSVSGHAFCVSGCVFYISGCVLVCGSRHGVGVHSEPAAAGGGEPGSSAAVRGAPLPPSQRRGPPRARGRLPRTPPGRTPFRRGSRC